MDKKEELTKSKEELDLAMINLIKGMTEDLGKPTESFEMKYLKDRVLVLETKLDTILQFLLK